MKVPSRVNTNAIEPLERRLLLAAAITPIATQPSGPLSGKIVFTHGGHGYTANSSGAWAFQRPLTNNMLEDFGNQEQMTAYVNYLFNAGATVVPMRPVGHQTNEVVLDNDSPGVSFSGTWSNSTATSLFFGTAGDVAYRFATVNATETAVAKYMPNIPAAGFYPVYGWASDGANRATDQLYRVTHSGGAMEVRVNHRRVGKGWVYLGTYHFEAGSSGFVEVSNKSTSAGSVVIADAIRFGNGMGNVNRGAGISGRSREDEAALYWIIRSAGVGVASTVYAPSGVDSTDNVGAPIRWAAHMNAQGVGPATDRVYLSFHSNAGGGAARGTLGLFNDPGNATANQEAWAELVGREVNDDLVAIGAPPMEFVWSNRSVVTLNRSDIDFGEIDSGSINNEMDATIVEVAFHDNATDAALMRDPKVRDWVGRAAYQATVRYFATFPATAPVNLLPGAPTNVRTSVAANGDVTVSWNAPVANSYVGQAATGYRIYASKNGYGFDGGIAVAGGGTTSHTIPAGQLDNAVYYFRVAAVNAGGESPPSEVAAARKPAVARPQVLIVNGFDRVDKAQDIHEPFGGSFADRVRPRLANSFDYVVQHASAIVAAGGDVEINSAANEAVIAGQVNLANYSAVFWISGEESAGDDTFNAAEQTLVRNYLDGGGKLFVTGSEIGWDLDAQNNGRSFYNNSLKADYVADDANTYSAVGVAGSIFAGISLNFDNASRFYDVDFADVIAPLGGATAAMGYSTGGGAAIQYASGNQRLVMMGFPFETITTATARTSLMQAVLSYFGLLATSPTFQGTAGADSYSVSFNPSSNTIEVLEQLAGTAPRAHILARPGLGFLEFTMLGGDDQLSINLAGTILDIRLDGGFGSDKLLLNGGTINLQPVAAGPIVLEDLVVAAGAAVNLASHRLILQPAATQRDQLLNSLVPLLRSGRNGGAWNGPGINSSTAAVDPRRITGLALIQESDSIIIALTLTGDSDLDQDIDADDYSRIDAGYASGAGGYQNGDFDYSGQSPDADDFFLIDRAAYEQSAMAAPATVQSPSSAGGKTVRVTTKQRHHRKPILRTRHKWKWSVLHRRFT